MPHVSASAEFLRLAGHLLAFDRGEELHLFEGLPRTWLGPAVVTRLRGLRTVFGPLTLTLKVARDGKTASLSIAALNDPSCRTVVVHLPSDPSGRPGATRKLAPGQAHELTIPLPPCE